MYGHFRCSQKGRGDPRKVQARRNAVIRFYVSSARSLYVQSRDFERERIFPGTRRACELTVMMLRLRGFFSSLYALRVHCDGMFAMVQIDTEL